MVRVVYYTENKIWFKKELIKEVIKTRGVELNKGILNIFQSRTTLVIKQGIYEANFDKIDIQSFKSIFGINNISFEKGINK